MTDYAALLRALAIPRRLGTANHDDVREILKRELLARGFGVEEHAFSGRPAWLLWGSPRRIAGVNLIARRPATRPSVWLVAHYDSKGQPISMAMRLAGVALLVAGLLGLVLTPWSALGALAGLVIVSQNRVTDDSPGAVDNASALVTIFMTLDAAPKAPIGVIFPDAEEYGLVGARALAAERSDLLAHAAVVNLDGVDDAGTPTAFVHRAGAVTRAVTAALDARASRWLPVIVDGIALRRVAGECVSIMKGSWRTTRVVHTPHDTADRLSLAGARQVAAGLARVLSGP